MFSISKWNEMKKMRREREKKTDNYIDYICFCCCCGNDRRIIYLIDNINILRWQIFFILCEWMFLIWFKAHLSVGSIDRKHRVLQRLQWVVVAQFIQIRQVHIRFQIPELTILAGTLCFFSGVLFAFCSSQFCFKKNFLNRCC